MTTKRTYPKMTKNDIKELAYKIVEVLSNHEMASDLRVYYNNKCLQTKMKVDAIWNVYYETDVIDNISPHDYFRYAANDHIISISTEGGLYDELNYGSGEFPKELRELFDYWGIYYELGEAWNLSFFPCDDDENRIEFTRYTPKDKPVFIHYNVREDCPEEILPIMDTWWTLSSLTGDSGSCVIGSYIGFKYQGKKYEMGACSPYQGEFSWYQHAPLIMRLLRGIGATEVYYEAGRLD